MKQTILIETIKKDAHSLNLKITLGFLVITLGFGCLTILSATYLGSEYIITGLLVIATGLFTTLFLIGAFLTICNLYDNKSHINNIRQPYLIAKLYFKILPNRFWERLVLKKLSIPQIYQKYKNPPVYTKLLLEEVRDYYENEPFLIFIALRILELELKLIQSNWHHVVKTPKSFTEKLKVVQEKMEQQENLK